MGFVNDDAYDTYKKQSSLFGGSRLVDFVDDTYSGFVRQVEEDEFSCTEEIRADDTQLVSLQKRSIYSKQTVARLTEIHGLEHAEQMVTGLKGLLIQVAANAFHGLVFEWALWKEDIEGKRIDHVPGMLYLIYYIFSCSLGYLITLISAGPKGARECWDIRALASFIPAGTTLALSETLDNFVLFYVTSDFKGVGLQLRIAAIALIGAVCLGRRQSLLQWLLIGAITLSILGYAVVRLKSATDIHSQGVQFILFQVVSSSVSSVLADVAFKKLKNQPFPTQMAQARLSSVIATIVMLIAYCGFTNSWHQLPFGGWNMRIIMLAIWLAVRDWSQTLILKVLSAVWKGLACAVALAVTYVVQTMIRGEKWNPLLILFIMSMIVDIVGYALSRNQSQSQGAKKT